MSQKPNIDVVVEKYIETRDEIKRLEKELEEKLKPLKEFQDAREMYMLGLLNEAGCQNMKTKHGTAYVLTKESVTMGDWDAFENWTLKQPLARVLNGIDIPVELKDLIFTSFFNEAHLEFLTHSVVKTPVLDLLKEGTPAPPGVNVVQTRTVGIRKS